MSSPRPPPWPVPPHSPPASPTPSRLPKPKGNRLVKSPDPSGKRGKSPARAKGSEDRRTSLQVNTSPAPASVHGGSNRRLSLGARPPSTTGRQPTTPTINVSFASSGSGLHGLSASASASSTSFNQSHSQSAYGSGNDSPNSTSTHLPLSSRNTSPHASWIPGAPYMPGANSTTLAAITSTETHPHTTHFPASTSESNLIPPQGLFGPLLVRENVLRARERERAASMGMMMASSSSPTPDSNGHSGGYLEQSQPPAMSASAGQIHGLLEASGLVAPPEGNGTGRARFNSVASVTSAATGSSWSNSVSMNTTISAGAAAGVSGTTLGAVGGGGGGGGRDTSSSASSGHILPAGGEEDGEEGEDWLRREGMLDGMSSMTHDTYHTHGGATSSNTNLPRESNLAHGMEVTTPTAPTPTPGPILAPPVKLSKSSSLRSTLPSIRSFRNPFSFSRSASTSGAPSSEKAKEREKSKERSKSKERPSILPIGNKNHSGSNLSLPVPSSPTNRFTYTPISQRNQPTSPASPTFASQMQTQTLPRASVDTILPNSHLHGAVTSPGGANRFGFSARAGRHSMDSPVGYTYGRLGTMFAGGSGGGGPVASSATPPPVPAPATSSGGRIPVQAAYANGSRERVVAEQAQFQQTHGHSASLGGVGVGRVSPALGRGSPAFSGGGGGLGITGLVRPPGLDPHMELDERSMRTESGYGFGGSERTESGYGFGGIQVSGDGVMLSPVDDLDEPYPFANHVDNQEEGEEDEEREVHALLGDGVFEGEYESTEGHAAATWATSARTSPVLNPYESRPISQANTFGSPADPPPASYPYPTTYPEQEQSPDTSGEVSNTTLAEPRLPPGLEHLIQQVEARNGMESEPSRDSTVERDLLGELARQLQRVVEQQSTTTLASRPPLSPSQPHTPSSILMFDTGGSSQDHGRASEETERLDEFGRRWNISDLKGAVERMKVLIDEQEKRTKRPSGHAHTRSTNSISLNDTPPPIPDTSLPSENSARHFPAFAYNGQTTPRRLSNTILTAQDVRGDAKRKESQSSSSATATSTTVVTPTTPYDGPSFPLPNFKNGVHERVESFDFASLDPDLVAMLSPNHMDPSQAQTAELDRRGRDVVDNREYGISFASSALLPSTSPSSTPSRPKAPEFNQSSSNMPSHLQEPVQSFAMGEDLTIATVASDGFGSMRSDKSVEEILLQRNFEYDQTGVEESKEEHSNSIALDALALEPVATSSPPRKKLLHTPRASSVSALPASNSSKRDRQEKASSSSTHLLPVSEDHQSQFSFPSQNSPSKSSPSRSPLSKLRGKDRPPLPQFEADQQEQDVGATETGSAHKMYPNGNKSAGAAISPSPSPTPPSRPLQGSGTMLTQLGHGRRPPSRTGGASEISSIDRMRRVVTGGSDGYRSLNQEDARHPRLQSITGSQSDNPPSRVGLDLSLGPRTARAFAAAGVLDGGPGSAPVNRVATWRSASVMGYRRDGIDREFGDASGTRSLASSPIPMAGMPGPSGAAARRIATLHERDLHGGDTTRMRATSDAWNRSIFTRTPDSSLRNLNMGGGGTDPSATSSPTSTGPPRTTMSSSTSSNLPPFELKAYRGSPTVPEAAAANAQHAHQAVIQTLKERHELEKEALLSALSEAKKEARVEKAAKEELSLELTEMGVYVEELETKLGEALARIRWMEKEIGILRDAVGVAKRGSPMRDPQSSLRQSVENKRFARISSPAPGTYNDDNIFGPRPNSRLAESPVRTRILINHVPASPPADEDEPRNFPVYDEDQSPLRNRSHRRISSDASSIAVPRVDQSMSMLLQENGYADGYDESGLYSANEGSSPPSPTIVIGKIAPRSGEMAQPASTGDGNLLATGANHRIFGLQTPSRSRRNQLPSTIMEMSPTTTTADYSFNPGSPGSLVLRPEDEHHLGDLLSLMGSDDGM